MSTEFHCAPEVPLIETERLRLRGHRMADFSATAALWADMKVVHYITGRPLTEEEAWTRFLRYIGHWAVFGYGYWVAEEKTTGEFIGEMGFADYRRELQPSLDGMPEIGWVLASHAHGKGLATEAVRAMVRWADRRFGAAPTACIITPENVASIRVAEKCGYRELRDTTYHGHTVKMFVREAGRG